MNARATSSVRILSTVVLVLAAAGCSDTETTGAGGCSEGQVLVGDVCAWPSPGSQADVGYGGDAQDGALADITPGGDAFEKDSFVKNELPPVIDLNDVPDQPDVPCTEGERRCRDSASIEICKQKVWMVEIECPGDLECKGAMCVEVLVCEAGQIEGCMTQTSIRQCDEEGESFVGVPCPEGKFCLDGVCGDEKCKDLEKVCLDAATVGQCAVDGKDYEFYEDCGEGSVCVGGKCLSGCEALVKYNKSYIGCEYWATDLDQYDESAFAILPGMKNPLDAPWGVVISNPGKVEAAITFVSPDPAIQAKLDQITNATVPAGNAKDFVLPTINVEGTSISQKGIQILSDRPVFMHQFNPLNNEDVASNDASLLLPVHALGTEYYVTTQPSSPTTFIEGQRGYFSILGVMKGETQVTVEVTCDTLAGVDMPTMAAGGTATYTISQFDVLNIEADAKLQIGGCMGDLTGSHVYSNKPIVVFSGHEESVIAPDETKDSCCAEHLEEQMFPVESWRDHFVAVKTKPRGSEPDVWRVMGGATGVKVATTPSIAGLDGQILGKGKWVEVVTSQSFEIQGTGPLQVAQFTVSNNQTEQFTGDPSMIMVVPSAQFRSNYTIMVPKNYQENFVTVTRPAGAALMVDAAPVADNLFQPVGTGAYEAAYLPLTEGVHYFESDQKFGLSAYGWSSVVSYGYPGGLDLDAE